MDLLPAVDYDSVMGRSPSEGTDMPTSVRGSGWNEDEEEIGLERGRQVWLINYYKIYNVYMLHAMYSTCA